MRASRRSRSQKTLTVVVGRASTRTPTGDAFALYRGQSHADGGDAALAAERASAEPLGVSRQRLNDIEKGAVAVSVERAAHWAEILGYSAAQFVELALQAQLDAAGLHGLKVRVTPLRM